MSQNDGLAIRFVGDHVAFYTIILGLMGYRVGNANYQLSVVFPLSQRQRANPLRRNR